MKEIARFYDAEEAQIATGFLRAQGLDVHLADKQALAAMPQLRVGLGGFRLLAAERDANIAKRLLADIKAENRGSTPCARCGSSDTTRIRDFRFPLIFGVLSLLFPFAPPVRCRNCGHKQQVTDEEETAP